MTEHILQVGAYLLLIVGLIFLCGFLMKQMNQRRPQGGGAIKVVASLSLGLKEKVVLIQVGDEQQVLLGVTPGQINKLESYAEPVILQGAEGFTDFRQKLQEIMNNNQAQGL